VKYYISCDSHAPKRKVLKPCVAWEKGEAFKNIIYIFLFLMVLQVKERFLEQAAKARKSQQTSFTTFCSFFPSCANLSKFF